MAGSLDRIHGIIAVVWHRNFHKISRNERAAVRQSSYLIISPTSFDLIFMIVDAGDVGARKRCDCTHRSAYAAADVEHLHAGLEPQYLRQMDLMAGKGCAEGLPLSARREVEGLSPADFVEVRDEVIIMIDHRHVARLARLARSGVHRQVFV